MPRVLDTGAVFLDYDGTLTPIVNRPELAVLSEEVRAVLRCLSAVIPVTIVTGRDVTVVQDLVGVAELGYVGSHGLDVLGPVVGDTRLRLEVGTPFLTELDAVEARLKQRTRSIAGVFIERKRFSISTHVREVAATDHARVESIVDEVWRLHPSLRREGGKLLFELRPDVDWDKGRAVRWLLDGLNRDPDNALYIGDDLTDETAFVALDGAAVTVIVAGDVGDRPTAARFRVCNTTDVLTLLQRFVAATSRRAAG